ncbi:MAG: hypothetical protein WCR55_10720, partial [Lentisphaerota bacterium]
VIGDMLELGEAGSALHKDVLQTYLSLMSDCTLILVGTIMAEAIKSLHVRKALLFQNSDLAAEYIRENIKDIDTIYLKGSRGTKLEKIDQVFP